jgi:hypothetical protein
MLAYERLCKACAANCGGAGMRTEAAERLIAA